jgi:hypothetical protein
VPLDPEQRSRLLEGKLRALVLGSGLADTLPETTQSAGLPGAVALHTAGQAWILLDEQPERRLGAVMAWADRQHLDRVDVLVEQGAPIVARRAACFARPVAVWTVDGTSVSRARPADPHTTVSPEEAALDLVGTLGEAGLDIVIEHGEVLGEILGLEVARVVVDGDAARIEVGVGRHDREAFALVHGDRPQADALAEVVRYVRRYRRGGDLTHPLARLAGERWLRHELVRTPSLIGAARLECVEPVLPRESVKDRAPAIAVGTTTDGEPLVVASSVGVDLDLVPSAADARLAFAPDAQLVLAVPQRDALPVTGRLAGALARPAIVVAVPNDFRG